MKQVYLSFFLIGCFFQSCVAGYLPNELRLGVLKHDVGDGLNHRHEKGYDFNVESLWASPEYDVLKYIFAPRPHIGASLNTRGGSHQLYLGLTWRLDFLQYMFAEATFGGEVHTGKLNVATNRKQKLGCRFLFRESISLGVQINENHSLALLLDHASNASCSKHNPGLTGLGLRYGYKL